MSNAGVILAGRMFRTLTADEIDVRVGQVSKDKKTGAIKGVSLLLYKDARCDQSILDETVTPMRWMKSYLRDNANCVVSIFDTESKQWISKEDTGVESQTEKEKGLASDSFKRACVCWGIGRELYTAPFIYISADKLEFQPDGVHLKTQFGVSDIDYDEKGNITELTVIDSRIGKGQVLYRHNGVRKPTERPSSSHQTNVNDNAPEVVPMLTDAQKTARRAVVDHLKAMLGVDDKGFIGVYQSLVDNHVLPPVAMKNMNNLQFDAMVKAIQEHYEPA